MPNQGCSFVRQAGRSSVLYAFLTSLCLPSHGFVCVCVCVCMRAAHIVVARLALLLVRTVQFAFHRAVMSLACFFHSPHASRLLSHFDPPRFSLFYPIPTHFKLLFSGTHVFCLFFRRSCRSRELACEYLCACECLCSWKKPIFLFFLAFTFFPFLYSLRCFSSLRPLVSLSPTD